MVPTRKIVIEVPAECVGPVVDRPFLTVMNRIMFYGIKRLCEETWYAYTHSPPLGDDRDIHTHNRDIDMMFAFITNLNVLNENYTTSITRLVAWKNWSLTDIPIKLLPPETEQPDYQLSLF